MSLPIITAFRQLTQLHGNTFLIATELGHRMNSSGFGRVSYRYLAWKAHCSPHTAMRQIAKLLAMGLIRKTVIRTRAGYAWNHYQYLGALVHTASPPLTTRCPTVGHTLPDHEREKDTSLQADIAAQKQMLQRLVEGSQLWRWTHEDLQAREALLRT